MRDFGGMVSFLAESPEEAERVAASTHLFRLAESPADSDAAIALLRRGTALEDSMAFAFGPPDVDLPSHELLGGLLLARKQFAEAAHELETALRRTPGRVSVKRALQRAQRGPQ